ncbi:lactococcin 972 family bacteriocin [Streptomyces mobaraensis]|uniref:lactococcin 972 family bacteriocin n=1 Tax=Streptomyces mobaraensis TaxID=35621 RepID=UPI003317BB0E
MTAVAVAAAGCLATAGPANAAPQPQVYTATYTASSPVAPPAVLIGPHGEKPTKWGVARFSVNSAPQLIAPDTKRVGGGTWTYGGGMASNGRHLCYSNYVHPDKVHSATAVLGVDVDKRYNEPDLWAKASVVDSWDETCETYWGVY